MKNERGKITTARLMLRQLTQNDYPALCKILQDAEVMYAYEHAFSDEEVQEWLDRQLTRYEKYGNFGLWAVVLKKTGELIGQCGLTMQECKGKEVLEIGYLFQKKFWHQGYATEAAEACKKYAFEVLKAPWVCSIIRDNNIASQNVAKRNGMTVCDEFVKHYYGIDMPHLVFAAENPLITYKMVSENEITRELFADFIRRQVVTDCWRKMDGKWCIKSDPFVDDWNEKDYEFLIQCLKNTVRTGGMVMGTFFDGRLKGFVSVEAKPFGSKGQYLDLTSIHISQDMRGRGIGRKLFLQAKAWAKEHGAQKLYISAHSAVESQAFYKAMGCVEAKEYQQSHVEQEPYDCQLECVVSDI